MSKQGLIFKAKNGDGSEVYFVTEKGKLVLGKLKEVEYVLHA
jgi:predicted transcriptional regulator